MKKYLTYDDMSDRADNFRKHHIKESKLVTKIYFFRYGKYIKIGHSKNPEKRLSNIQTSNPKKVKLLWEFFGNIRFEYKIQRIFQKYHVRGEWFKDNEVLRTFIENIKGSPKIWGAYKRLPEEYKIYGKKFGSSPYQVGRLKDAYYAYEMYK